MPTPNLPNKLVFFGQESSCPLIETAIDERLKEGLP